MSNLPKLHEIDQRIREIKKANRSADVTAILREALSQVSQKDERLYLLSRLADEYHQSQKHADAEATIKDEIEIDPNRADSWLQLASHYFYHVRDLPNAKATIDVAVEKAAQEGSFVHQAHAERIRIALAAKDYNVIADSLAKLIEHVPGPASIDVELESDFLQRIPEGIISKDLIRKYKRKVGQDS